MLLCVILIVVMTIVSDSECENVVHKIEIRGHSSGSNFPELRFQKKPNFIVMLMDDVSFFLICIANCLTSNKSESTQNAYLLFNF